MRAKATSRGGKTKPAVKTLYKSKFEQMPKGGSTYVRIDIPVGKRVRGMSGGKIKTEQMIGTAGRSRRRKPR